MKVNEAPVIVEQKFELPIETVWKAITDVKDMRQWFFDNIPAFEPKVGFMTRFNVSTEHQVFPHIWNVTEVIPLRKLVYNWKYEGLPGDSYVTFQLKQIKKEATLTLTTKVVEDFSDDIPEFKRESCLAGWQYFINERLVNYLAD